MPAPIALFVYNRPDHTRQTVDALRKNALAKESDLFVYSDAARESRSVDAVNRVRAYVKAITGFRSVTIIEREKNWGLDPSIIDGVTTLCDKFGHVIVLEDDLVTSPWFLTFMNEALFRYRNDRRVMQVGGFMFPIKGFDDANSSFLPFATCWGWATWKRAWNQFDAAATGYSLLENDASKRKAFDLNGAYYYFDLLKNVIDGKSEAWDIRWYLSIFLNDGLALFPHKSLVRNIGFDGSGTHDSPTVFVGNSISKAIVNSYPPVQINHAVWKEIERYLKRQRRSRVKNFFAKFAWWE